MYCILFGGHSLIYYRPGYRDRWGNHGPDPPSQPPTCWQHKHGKHLVIKKSKAKCIFRPISPKQSFINKTLQIDFFYFKGYCLLHRLIKKSLVGMLKEYPKNLMLANVKFRQFAFRRPPLEIFYEQ